MREGIVLISFVLLAVFAVSAAAFIPPIYIANPTSGECKYYFEGDARHHNERPENFTFNVGLTTDTKCEYWYLCRGLNGSNPGIGWADGKCVCPPGFEFNESYGCITTKLRPEIITCTNTSGVWEKSQPENFSCSTYCDEKLCRQVDCAWKPGCACPLGTKWNTTLGCISSKSSDIFTRFLAWLRKVL